MSTRAQIIVKDERQELWFYRHSDGYPDGALPLLEKFLNYVKDGSIRVNVEQAGGWLILLGADEYNEKYDSKSGKFVKKETLVVPNKEDLCAGWKCGSIEPCACNRQHDDIQYLYTVNLVDKTITWQAV